MPSPTFFRLAEEKRRRIFDAAVAEFAAYRFSDASINRVVKAAGIPRGSFYQYFANKEDLYTYVLQEISKEKIGILSASQLAAGGKLDFYQLLATSLPGILSWAENNELYSRIGMLMLEGDPSFLQNVFDGMTDSLGYARELLLREQRAGRIRPGVQPETVLRLILAAAVMIMRDYFSAGNMEEARQRMMAIYDIICYGAVLQSGGEEL